MDERATRAEVQDMQAEEVTRNTEGNAQQRESEEGAWQRCYVEELRGGDSSPQTARSAEQLGLPLTATSGMGEKTRRLLAG